MQFAQPGLAEPIVAEPSANGAPLLSYRRTDDAGLNPLRRPAPTVAVVDEPLTSAPGYGAASYGAPTAANSLPQFDANVRPTGTAPIVPATPLPSTTDSTKQSTELAPAPLAPLDDYAAAPLAATSASTSPAVTPATAAPPAALPLSDDASQRRLAPRSTQRAGSAGESSHHKPSLFPQALAQFQSLPTAGAGLAVVVGLFLLCAWLLRRNGPKPSGVLPEAAFAILGRAPLTANSFAQLLRVGNKLVLVAMSADGAQPLAEVTDPAEVDRVAGLCVAGRPGGSSAEFQQVLAQLSKEPARGFLGREGSAARRRA